MLRYTLLSVLLIFYTLTLSAQTADETLEWLNGQKIHFKEGETTHHYVFTSTHLEYHGSSYKGKADNQNIVIYRWEHITRIGLGFAKVSTNFYLEGKGIEVGGDMPVAVDHSGFRLAHWSSKLDLKKFLAMISHMIELKGGNVKVDDPGLK